MLNKKVDKCTSDKADVKTPERVPYMLANSAYLLIVCCWRPLCAVMWTKHWSLQRGSTHHWIHDRHSTTRQRTSRNSLPILNWRRSAAFLVSFYIVYDLVPGVAHANVTGFLQEATVDI